MKKIRHISRQIQEDSRVSSGGHGPRADMTQEQYAVIQHKKG